MMIVLLPTGIILCDTPKASANNSNLQDKYSYEIVYQSPYPSTLPVNSVTNVYIDIKNTGTENWYKDGNFKIRLGTGSSYGNSNQKQDYKSEFYNIDWLSQNRASSIMDKGIVKPGETARFQFNIKTSDIPGAYRAYFTPVIDGLTWMKDLGIYWEIKTTESPTKIEITELQEQTNNQVGNQDKEAIDKSQSLISEYSQSVVKLVCKSEQDYIQQGSGILIKNSQGDGNLPTYYVLTNRHVVEPDDKSIAPSCLVYSNNGINGLLSTNFIYPDKTSDIAIINLDDSAKNDLLEKIKLDTIAFSSTSLKTRAFSNNYNSRNVTTIGFPKGIFEIQSDGEIINSRFSGGEKYIEISTKLEHGISGGIAVDSEGYLLGITSGRDASNGDGMVLDINYLTDNLKLSIF